MKHVTANAARMDFDRLLESVTLFNEPVTIVGDHDKSAVLLSLSDWSSIQETLYLQSIPGMVGAIQAADGEPLAEGLDAAEADFGV